MKPIKLDTSTDYRLALLWLMDRLESASSREATAVFGEEFRRIIPPEHRQKNDSGQVKWEHYVAWSRWTLVKAGLMGSGGRGVWTIAPAGSEWLNDNPEADHIDLAAYVRQLGTDNRAGLRWQGEEYSISKQALFSQARRLLKDGPPKEALRFRDWAVFVEDQPVSVKWLFSLVTGANYSQFDSPTARRALSQIGIEAQRLGEATSHKAQETTTPSSSIDKITWEAENIAIIKKASPPRITGAEKRAQRRIFLEQVAALLPQHLPEEARHGRIRFYEGKNYLSIVYPEFPRSHYEIRLARAFDEIAFHFEGKREENLARLALMASHVEQLSAALNRAVVAVPWGSKYARIAVESFPDCWMASEPSEYATLLSRFIDATYSLLRQAFEAVPGGRRRRRAKKGADPPTWDGSRSHAILEEEIARIRRFLQGRASRPSDAVLCEWVQFCYIFELFDEGHQLFQMIDHAGVNDWLYDRTKKLATVCRVRAR